MWLGLLVIPLILLVVLVHCLRNPDGPVQWCPDCGGRLRVRPARLSCRVCGWSETDPASP
jgi:hypothetical protein